MTATDYIQLRAFARYDGAFLGLLWITSFACTMLGGHLPFAGTLGLAFALLTPFFIVRRIATFRDRIWAGRLTFFGGYTYSMSMFFYGALLLALTQYLWFTFAGQDSLLATALDQVKQMLLANGYPEKEVTEAVADMRGMRPIDWAFYFLSTNIIMGFVVSIVVALLTRRKPQPQ